MKRVKSRSFGLGNVNDIKTMEDAIASLISKGKEFYRTWFYWIDGAVHEITLHKEE